MIQFNQLSARPPVVPGAKQEDRLMALKPLELRELSPEERAARERAIKKAKTAVKVRPLKKKK